MSYIMSEKPTVCLELQYKDFQSCTVTSSMKHLSREKVCLTQFAILIMIRQPIFRNCNHAMRPTNAVSCVLGDWKCIKTSSNGNFPRHHQSPVNSPHKGQWRDALKFSLICAWTNGWLNNRDAGDLRHHHAHYDLSVMDKVVQNS